MLADHLGHAPAKHRVARNRELHRPRVAVARICALVDTEKRIPDRIRKHPGRTHPCRRWANGKKTPVEAARQNVKKAQQAAKRKRTIANLPASTRRELGKQAAEGRQRGGEAGHTLEDRNRQQLYEIAKERNIRGRSKMGKWEPIEAIRKHR
jgi:hypothetical protein